MKRSIALVLVNYRNAEDTVACLKSLEATDHASLAVHVVDNASGDGSREAIAEYLTRSPLDSRLHSLTDNLGYAGGMNAGLRAALAEGADFLVVMNNDVTVDPGFGPALLAAFRSRPEAALAGSVLHMETGRPAHNVGRISPWTLRIRYLFEQSPSGPVDFVSGCLLGIPASVAARVGLLEEKYFMYCEDLEYCLRLRAAGIQVAFHPEVVIRHRVNGSVNKLNFAKEYYLIRNQTHVSLAFGNALQKVIYVLTSVLVLAWKARHPWLFRAFLRAYGDALAGRLGRR